MRAPSRALATGLAAVDDLTGGGFPLAALTEIVCAAPSCGGQLLLGQLLTITRSAHQRVLLIDPADTFDPASFASDQLAHLVWVRGGTTLDALAAADLAARDANLGLVWLDLRRAPEADLRRISGPQWYRLQRAVEPTEVSLVVQTSRPSVPSARLRLEFTASHAPSTLDAPRPDLLATLAPSLHRLRLRLAAE